jgi:hypothetical protein
MMAPNFIHFLIFFIFLLASSSDGLHCNSHFDVTTGSSGISRNLVFENYENNTQTYSTLMPLDIGTQNILYLVIFYFKKVSGNNF